MTVDLETQIRGFAQAVDTAQSALTVAEVADRRLGTEAVRPIEPHRGSYERHRNRGWLVSAAAAAVLLVLVGGVMWIFGIQTEETAVATTAPNRLSSLVWSRLADGDDGPVLAGVAGVSGASITAAGPGFVAVGTSTLSDSDGDAVVWTSTDGITWSLLPANSAVFGGEGHQWMHGVAKGGPGVVAVGSDDGRAAVWTSSDGRTWSRVPHDETVFGESGSRMLSVTAGGPGLVAVGSDDRLGVAVWTSPDGLTWSRVPHDDAVFGGERDVFMMDVAAAGPGLVAVGGVGGLAAIWTSADGLIWSRVPHDDDLFGVESSWIVSVTAGGPGVVAVGTVTEASNQSAGVWTSVDGVTWSLVTQDDAVFGEDGWTEMRSVVAVNDGLIAVGLDGDDAAVWTSVDGITWSRVPHDATFGLDVMWGVAFGDRRVVAVGGHGAWTAVTEE